MCTDRLNVNSECCLFFLLFSWSCAHEESPAKHISPALESALSEEDGEYFSTPPLQVKQREGYCKLVERQSKIKSNVRIKIILEREESLTNNHFCCFSLFFNCNQAQQKQSPFSKDHFGGCFSTLPLCLLHLNHK